VERKGAIILLLAASLCVPVFAFAEKILLKSGKTVEGKILEETDEHIKVGFQGEISTYDLDEIEDIDGEVRGGNDLTLQQDQADVHEFIQNILAKYENTALVQYKRIDNTYVVSDLSNSIASRTLRIWQKSPFVKVDFNASFKGSTTFSQKIIIRPEGIYACTSPQEEYELVTEVADMSHLAGVHESIREIRENESLKSLGTETIDGKPATVIEYTCTGAGGDRLFKRKAWLWNAKGLPLKVESKEERKGVTYVTIIEYKEYSFEDIADSVFEVPQR